MSNQEEAPPPWPIQEAREWVNKTLDEVPKEFPSQDLLHVHLLLGQRQLDDATELDEREAVEGTGEEKKGSHYSRTLRALTEHAEMVSTFLGCLAMTSGVPPEVVKSVQQQGVQQGLRLADQLLPRPPPAEEAKPDIEIHSSIPSGLKPGPKGTVRLG